jgi:predicted dehydrogenase
MTTPRVGLVGIGGYGRVHLEHLLDLHASGEIQFAAAVAFPPETDRDLQRRLSALPCELLPDFAGLIAALPQLRLDLCIVPTPIHLHAPMTVAALKAGCHVLVEKPIAASLEEVNQIIDASRAADRIVAVGFQYLHAPEIHALKRRILDGAIGRLQRVCVHAAWPRSHAYYARNDWAGRLQLNGAWVLDSPVNNAMSHFLMLMLFLAGSGPEAAAEPAHLTAELYRAQEIESFDTAVLHLELPDRCRLDFYGTHSSREMDRPSLVLEGTEGRAEWVQDGHATIHGRDSIWHETAGAESNTRERMLRAVLDRIRGRPAFVCPPELAAAHVRCVAALQQVPITPIPAQFRAEHTHDGARHTFVPELTQWLRRAAQDGVGLSAVGAPWAVPPTQTALGGLNRSEIPVTRANGVGAGAGKPRPHDRTGT